MGYTRYWERTDKTYDENFVEQINTIINKCNSLGITLANGFGEGSPEVNLDKIWINGPEENNLGHETFAIINTTNEHFLKGFDFCKTARKPYDYAVREILKIAEEEGIVTDVHSDGDNTEIISDIDYFKLQIPYDIYIEFTYKNKAKLDENTQNLVKQINEITYEYDTPQERFDNCKKICQQNMLLCKVFNDKMIQYKIPGNYPFF